jgi:hypothetical protein
MGKHKNANHEAKKASSEDPIPVAQRKDELRRVGAKPATAEQTLTSRLSKLAVSDKPQVKKLVAKLANDKAQHSQQGAGSSSGSGGAKTDIKENKQHFDPKAIAEKYGWTYTEQARCVSHGKAWILTHIQVSLPLGAHITCFAIEANEDALKTLMKTSLMHKCTRAAHKTAMIATALMRGARNVADVQFVEAAITKGMNDSIQDCIQAQDKTPLPTQHVLASQAIDPTGQTLLSIERAYS